MGRKAQPMTDTEIHAAAQVSKAWPFEEARKLVKRYPQGKPGGEAVLFETGYGPSGLPHIGTFQEVLHEWGHTWMWEGLKLSGEDGNDTGAWLSTAIRNNTLVAVTDGSCMKELYPNMNSCAFIFECTKKRGRMTGAFPEQTAEAGSY